MADRQCSALTFVPSTLGGLCRRLWSRWDRPHADAFYLLLNNALAALSGFVFWFLAAHLYPAEAVGLAAAAIASMTLLSLIGNLGLGYGLVRFVPTAGSGATDLINWSVSVATLASLLMATIFLIGVPLWSPALIPLRETPLVSLGFVGLTALWALNEVQGLTFVAFQRAEFVLAKSAIHAVVRIALVAAFAGFLENHLSILYSWAIASLLVVVITWLLLVRRVYPDYRPLVISVKRPSYSFLWFSLSNAMSNVVLLLPTALLPLLVISLIGAEMTAYFYVAWSIGFLLTAPAVAFSLSLFAEGSRSQEQLARAVRRVSLPLVGITVTGALLAVLFGDKLLLIYGRDYSEEGTALLRWMAAASIPATVSHVYIAVLRVRRRNLHFLATAGVLSATTVAASYMLLSDQGIAGTGVGWLIGNSAVLLLAAAHWLINRRGDVTSIKSL